MRHYVHIGTGNYHPKTARLYTDFGLFTTDDEIGADVADMFNFLTGMARPLGYRKLLIAPNGMREALLEEIDDTIEAHERGEHARISAEDELARRPPDHPRAVPRVARRRAGRAQRPRDLLPAPGVEGVSDNITRRQRARALPRALAHLLASSAATRRACSSAPPTSCRATSTRASSSSRPSRTRRSATTCSTRSSARSRPTRAPGSFAPTATGSGASPATRRARCSASSWCCTPRAPARRSTSDA